jgi:hypothetical protein
MPNQTVTNRILAVLNEPSTSDWLKNAVKSALNRDPVDALNDATLLSDLLRQHLYEMEARAVAPVQLGPEDVVQTLETMVDRHGLLHVLTGLELMCSEKADHIRENWQDTGLAAAWDRAGLQAGRAARSDAVAKLP